MEIDIFTRITILVTLFLFIVLFIFLLIKNYKTYNNRKIKIKRDIKIPIKDLIAYSIGMALLKIGVLMLAFLIMTIGSSLPPKFIDFVQLLGTFLTSVGLSIGIYMEQRLDNLLEKHELVDAIVEDVSNEILKQLTTNIDNLSESIVEKTAERISLKVRPRPLRKEIAKQIAKSKKFGS